METVREQLVKRPSAQSDKIKQYLILFSALLLATASMVAVISFLGGVFMIAGIMLAALILWGGYYLTGLLNVEYEYCIAGAELTIDKITDQKKRKTLCSLNLKSAVGFYKTEKPSGDACAISAEGKGEVYTIEFTDSKLGRTMLYFTPDQRTLDMITPYLPRLS